VSTICINILENIQLSNNLILKSMGDLTEDGIQEDERQTLPKQSIDKNAIQRLINKLKSPDTLEQVTGGTPATVEDLTQQGPSPISPLDDFLQPTTVSEEQPKQEE